MHWLKMLWDRHVGHGCWSQRRSDVATGFSHAERQIPTSCQAHSSTTATIIKMPSFKETVEAQVAKTPVVVYSKSYCPYCTETKNLLNELGVKYDVVELDVIADGEALQDAVEDITGRCKHSAKFSNLCN